MGKIIASELMKKHFNIKRKDFKKIGLDVNYKIYIEENRVVLVFEQALDLMDFINSAKFPKKVYKNQQSLIEAPTGFIEAYKSCNDTVMEEFIKTCNKHPGYEFIISGFSFGGAMANLACEDFNYRTRTDKNNVDSGKKATVITFGSPLVYTDDIIVKDYVRNCTKGIYNFGYVWDLVPKVPPVKLGYSGINQYFIGRKNFWSFVKSINPWYGHRTAYWERKNYKDIKIENNILEV